MFVKIPHHGSHTSDKLPTILENIDIKAYKRKITAVTTTFVSQITHLPDTSVLDKYKCISRKILHTNKKAEGHNNYGICSLKYRYNSRVPDYNYEGDAYVYYESTNAQKNNKLSNKERTSEFCFLMSGCCVDRGVLRSGLI